MKVCLSTSIVHIIIHNYIHIAYTHDVALTRESIATTTASMTEKRHRLSRKHICNERKQERILQMSMSGGYNLLTLLQAGSECVGTARTLTLVEPDAGLM